MLLARRLFIALALLMVLMALAVALAPPPPEPVARERATRTQPDPTAATASRVVEARVFITDDAEPAVVEAAVGDTVRLEVHATTYEGVEIEQLDRFAALSPEAPATFDVLAERAGSFPIVLTESDREIGRLEVSRAR